MGNKNLEMCLFWKISLQFWNLHQRKGNWTWRKLRHEIVPLFHHDSHNIFSDHFFSSVPLAQPNWRGSPIFLKWWHTVFFHLLDCAVINSWKIYQSATGNWFTIKISESSLQQKCFKNSKEPEKEKEQVWIYPRNQKEGIIWVPRRSHKKMQIQTRMLRKNPIFLHLLWYPTDARTLFFCS